MLNKFLFKCRTFAVSVYSYGRLTFHNRQQCGLFKATTEYSVRMAVCSGYMSSRVRNSGLCPPLLLTDNTPDALAYSGFSVSIGVKTVIGYITLLRLDSAAEKDAYSGWPLAPWTTHYDKCVTHYYAKNTLATEWGEAT